MHKYAQKKKKYIYQISNKKKSLNHSNLYFIMKYMTLYHLTQSNLYWLLSTKDHNDNGAIVIVYIENEA